MPDPIYGCTPVGRVINHSLFEKDVYKDAKGREADPSYKIELAIDTEEELADLEDLITDACIAEWGASAEDDYWNGHIKSPIRDGDEMADDREKRGKRGDAYRGKFVIRAHSIFNLHGEDAPGGVYVCDENAEPLGFANRDKIYRGCYGQVAVTVSPYTMDGRRGVTLYLNGFQFVKDGDRLTGDRSSLFSPMMAPGSESKGRRKRASK